MTRAFIDQYYGQVTRGKELTDTQLKMLSDRINWENQYSHFLSRKNAFHAKLLAHSRDPNKSAKYAELRTEVDKYHNLLRGSLPAYRRVETTGRPKVK